MPTPKKRNGSWRIRFMHKGQRYSITDDTKSGCTEKYVLKRYLLKNGTPKHSSKKLWVDALERYRKEVSPRKKGARWEVLRIKRLEREPLALVPLQDHTPNDWGQWRDARIKQVATSTVNRELNLISSIWSQAIKEWGWCDNSPVSGLWRPKNPPPRDRRISEEETAAIIAELPTNPAGEATKVLFLLALECGARLGELCGIRQEDYHGEWVSVDGKTGPRDVPLTVAAQHHVADLLRLPPIRPAYASKLFGDAVRSARVEDMVFHDSRHEACFRLSQKLPNVMDLAKITGHTDLKTLLKVYYNPTAADLAAKLR